MFSGSVVDTKSDILVLEVEASGCGVLTVRKKIRNPESDYSINLLIAFLCRFKHFASLNISENCFLLNNRVHIIVLKF